MANWAKLVERKQDWAREGRLLTGRTADPAAVRLPPGQERVRDWPVLDLGNRPVIPERDWSLTVGGMVRKGLRWTYRDLEARPQASPVGDIHCVTGWSRFDNHWQGLPMADLLAAVGPRAAAGHAIIKGFDGYTTCLSLDDLRRDGVLLATRWEGQPLTRDHGGPVRLVVPHLYFWKSAKWLRQIWFTDRPVKGTWESRGYHDRGDPWREQRYGC